MMNAEKKTLVIYFSKYGTTKRYAEWVAADLHADIYSVRKIKASRLRDYDTIIWGSALHAGNIKGARMLVRNFDALKDKKLVFYTCGLADYALSENIAAIAKRIEQIIPDRIREHMKFFHLRGGIDYKTLSAIDKFLMGMLRKSIMKKAPSALSRENREFLATYGQKVDFTDKSTIKELVAYCRTGATNSDKDDE
jgi:menaquinone-dependent protoporphyrinogen IX oxidase